MRTIVIIENGRIEVQVDDQAPVVVSTSPLPAPLLKEPTGPVSEPPRLISPAKPHPTCGFCRKRGSACIRHGGTDSQKYQRVSQRPSAPLPMPTAPPPVKHGTPNEMAEITAIINEQRANFSDPWNCEMCRNAGDLCTLHESLTKDGKKPLIGKGIQR